jgi:hypothetical protein
MIDHVYVYPLTILFVFTTVLLLIGVLYSRIHWVCKSMLTLLSLLMFYIFYATYVGALGWPVATALPEKFEFLAADVHEPDMKTGDAGTILLWARPRDDDEPRGYILPYSRSMHETVQEARKRGKGGMPVHMQVKKKIGDPNLRPDTHFMDGGELDFVPPPNTAPPKQD